MCLWEGRGWEGKACKVRLTSVAGGLSGAWQHELAESQHSGCTPGAQHIAQQAQRGRAGSGQVHSPLLAAALTSLPQGRPQLTSLGGQLGPRPHGVGRERGVGSPSSPPHYLHTAGGLLSRTEEGLAAICAEPTTAAMAAQLAAALAGSGHASGPAGPPPAVCGAAPAGGATPAPALVPQYGRKSAQPLCDSNPVTATLGLAPPSSPTTSQLSVGVGSRQHRSTPPSQAVNNQSKCPPAVIATWQSTYAYGGVSSAALACRCSCTVHGHGREANAPGGSRLWSILFARVLLSFHEWRESYCWQLVAL